MISAGVPSAMKNDTGSIIQTLFVYHWGAEHHDSTLPNTAGGFQTWLNYLVILEDYLRYWYHARSLVS